MILAQPWEDKDWKVSPFELSIVQGLNLRANLASLRKHPTTTPPASTSQWNPPLERFVKMNFDGASKGNLGQAGYGRVFRNNKGNILRMYGGQMGINTNNVVELQALEEGLHSRGPGL
jgi:hypothetical protein